MSDVTIPAADAAHIATILRGTESGRPVAEPAVMRRLADLLDPPPSLRDEVAALVEPQMLHDEPDTARMVADDILAVARRYVEALPRHPSRWMDRSGESQCLRRDDVLRLLGSSDE